jgi:hypothetical protein
MSSSPGALATLGTCGRCRTVLNSFLLDRVDEAAAAVAELNAEEAAEEAPKYWVKKVKKKAAPGEKKPKKGDQCCGSHLWNIYINPQSICQEAPCV